MSGETYLLVGLSMEDRDDRLRGLSGEGDLGAVDVGCWDLGIGL
jgi:hypothetical protein